MVCFIIDNLYNLVNYSLQGELTVSVLRYVLNSAILRDFGFPQLCICSFRHWVGRFLTNRSTVMISKGQ